MVTKKWKRMAYQPSNAKQREFHMRENNGVTRMINLNNLNDRCDTVIEIQSFFSVLCCYYYIGIK